MTNAIQSRLLRAVAVLLALLGVCGSAVSAAEEPVPESVVTEPFEADQETDRWRYFRLTLSSGIDFSTGDFDTGTNTDVYYAPTSLKVEWDPFFIKVMLPYVVVDGDAVLIDGQPEGGPGLSGTRDGIGDVVLSAGYLYLPSSAYLPVVEFSGKVKFGTADEDKGLGTGEEDYTLQLDVSKRFGWFTPFGGVGYKFLGDPPGLDFNDKIFASGGFSARLGDRVSVGVVYDWAQSAVEGRSDIQEISPFASFRFGKRLSIGPYGLVGLSSSSPDWGMGVQFRVFWDND